MDHLDQQLKLKLKLVLPLNFFFIKCTCTAVLKQNQEVLWVMQEVHTKSVNLLVQQDQDLQKTTNLSRLVLGLTHFVILILYILPYWLTVSMLLFKVYGRLNKIKHPQPI